MNKRTRLRDQGSVSQRLEGGREFAVLCQEAEARLAARRAARAEARDIRLRELEKQAKALDQQQINHVPITVRENKQSCFYTNSRRSSEDSLDPSYGDSGDYKNKLNDLEEKLRKAIVTNTQLENEKQNFLFQVDSLKDDYEEVEENFYRLQRDFKEKTKAHELLNNDYKLLEKEHEFLEACIRERDQLIKERGLTLLNGEELLTLPSSSKNVYNNLVNGDFSDTKTVNESVQDSNNLNHFQGLTKATLISKNLMELLSLIQGANLEDKLKKIVKEKLELGQEIRQLKISLEEEKQKSVKLEELSLVFDNQSINGSDTKLLEAQKESAKLMHEYKFKLKKAQQEVVTLQNNVSRLETQVLRYKNQSEEAENLEKELKSEKRKILREFRDAQARIEELETSNDHLQKRIDKLKNNRMSGLNNT